MERFTLVDSDSEFPTIKDEPNNRKKGWILIKERTGSRRRALPLTAFWLRLFQENNRPFRYGRMGGILMANGE